jgi:hypothetical protein
MELKDLVMDGVPLENIKDAQFPDILALHIKEYIKEQDADVLERIRKNPDLYKWIIFPLNGSVYAAVFIVTVSSQAFQLINEFISECRNPFNMAYAYVFDSFDMIEGFIQNRAITKTDESSLYRIGSKLYYMASDELYGLSEFFITGQKMSMCVINERGDVIIGNDAYGKICSYLYRPT